MTESISKYDQFMEIVTLQNSTFNAWTWVIGTIILLIIAGMKDDKDPAGSMQYVLYSLIWPFCIPVLMGIALVSLPFLLGKKIKTLLWNNER